jgi:S1-C subfamily serine protease
LLLYIPLLLVAKTAGSHDAERRGEIIARTLASTVQLVTRREGGGRRAGSAVVLTVEPDSGRSLILTANHLFDPPEKQSIHVIAPLRRKPVAARVLAADAGLDLALVEATGLDVAPVAFKPQAVLGDGVWVVAFPWGRRRTIVGGVVSQIHWGEDSEHTVEPITGPVRLIDASVSYGMSGGGVFDRETGTLLGIVRGYRSAKLSMPGSDTEPLTIPVAGETTVIATPRILCFLETAGVAPPIAAMLTKRAYGDGC